MYYKDKNSPEYDFCEFLPLKNYISDIQFCKIGYEKHSFNKNIVIINSIVPKSYSNLVYLKEACDTMHNGANNSVTRNRLNGFW